jgi:putative heme transporter
MGERGGRLSLGGTVSEAEKRARPLRKAVRIGSSIAVMLFIFGYALPRVVDYASVWRAAGQMTPIEIASLLAISLWNIVTYWFVMVSSLPGSNIWQAMKVNQTSTAVANTVPGGSAVGIAITYGMYSAYGFPRNEIGLSIIVSGLWNNFVKLGMPILAIALLALQGETTTGRLIAALLGVGFLVAALTVFALTLRSDKFARRFGRILDRLFSRVRRLVRKPEVTGWDERTARFRSDAVELLKKRWVSLTLATTVSHVTLFLVLLMAVRHVGIGAQVSWVEVLAVFAFIRLLTALPITPGGVGVVELGMSAALIAAGAAEAPAVAAVLVYRVLTYVVPIPFGLLAYLRWTRGAKRRSLRAEERRSALAETPVS